MENFTADVFTYCNVLKHWAQLQYGIYVKVEGRIVNETKSGAYQATGRLPVPQTFFIPYRPFFRRHVLALFLGMWCRGAIQKVRSSKQGEGVKQKANINERGEGVPTFLVRSLFKRGQAERSMICLVMTLVLVLTVVYI